MHNVPSSLLPARRSRTASVLATSYAFLFFCNPPFLYRLSTNSLSSCMADIWHHPAFHLVLPIGLLLSHTCHPHLHSLSHIRPLFQNLHIVMSSFLHQRHQSRSTSIHLQPSCPYPADLASPSSSYPLSSMTIHPVCCWLASCTFQIIPALTASFWTLDTTDVSICTCMHFFTRRKFALYPSFLSPTAA
jgi:hypothetical protein